MKKFRIVSLLLVFALIVSLGFTACKDDKDTITDVEQEGQVDDKDKNDQEKDDKDADQGNENLAEKQEISVNLVEEPPSLDPQVSTDVASAEILQDTLEGLIRLDNDGLVKENTGMAKEWDISEDGTVYTFHLREASWSDGIQVKARDFEYAWKRLLNPKTASEYTFMAYDIVNAKEYASGDITDPDKVGVKAIDDTTLQVTLKSANPVFVSKLQHSTFFPTREDLVEEHGDKYASEAHLVPSCGPFKVEEWKHESKLVLVKNPLYWDADSVKLDKIVFHMIKNSNSIMGMYKTGQLDYTNIPSQFLDQYKDKRESYNEASTGYKVFNTDSKYLSSVKLRKAIRMSIDQTKVYETLASGTTQPAYAFVPPGIPGYDNKTFRQIAGDKLFEDIGTGVTEEEIKALVEEGLEEQGMKIDDIQGKINYLTSESDNALRYAEVYKEMIEKYTGINTGIEQATFKVRLQRRTEGDFTFVGGGWIGDYNDAMTFMDLFLSDSPMNDSGFQNEEYDAYVKKAMSSYDQKERVDSMIEAEKILIDGMPISPSSYSTVVYVEKPYVKNIVRLPLQVYNGKKWAYVLEN